MSSTKCKELTDEVRSLNQKLQGISKRLDSAITDNHVDFEPSSRPPADTRTAAVDNAADKVEMIVDGKAFSRPVHTLERVKQQLERCTKCRDEGNLEKIFHSYAEHRQFTSDSSGYPHAPTDPNTPSKSLPWSKLPNALKDMGMIIDKEEFEEFFRMRDLRDPSRLDLDEFRSAVVSLSAASVEAWAHSLNFPRLIADAAPSVPGLDGLHIVASLTPEELGYMVEGLVQNLRTALVSQVEALRRSLSGWAKQQAMPMAGSKFDIVKMNCGAVGAFHDGVQKRIGVCHLKFLETMRAEHCSRQGHNHRFTTLNYEITTTPEEEWGVVVDGVQVKQENFKGKRRIPKIEDLLNLGLVCKAGLNKEEIIAVVLYTGPMYYIYNSMLRRYPDQLYKEFGPGNVFTTTIFVLVSCIQKISRVIRMPNGLRLYRGLGGTLDFPECFFKSDENGCTGYAEWGFMSTTADKEVAIRYSGITQNKPLPYILELRVGAVDRGACVREFSQYPHEVEYLFVPCSFLQQDGREHLHVIDSGPNSGRVVKIFPVKVNANHKTRTTEELVLQKKESHLAAFTYQIYEIADELNAIALKGEAENRMKDDTTNSEGKFTLQGFLARIVEQCWQVRSVHESISSTEYAENHRFRDLVKQMAEVKGMAISKLEEWLENTSSSFIAYRNNAELRTCLRRHISFLERDQMSHKVADDSKASAALRLCQVKGLVVKDVDEKNELFETPLMAAAAEGLAPKFLRKLVDARGDVNQVRHDGVSSIWLAAQFGNDQSITELFNMGADVNKVANDGAAPIHTAAQNGHVECIKTLIELKANVDLQDKKGMTAMHQAAMNGHLLCIQELRKVSAKPNPVDARNKTPFQLAAAVNHQKCAAELQDCATEDEISSSHRSQQVLVASLRNPKKLIISTGDISDVDGFLALYEYAKTGADVMFIMNYPAYIGVKDSDADENHAENNPGLGYKYSAEKVSECAQTAEPSVFSTKYKELIEPYESAASHGEMLKAAMTDMAFAMAKGVWSDVTDESKGKLFFCIGGVNSINPFSATSIKNELLVYSSLVQLQTRLSTVEGAIFDADGKQEEFDWTLYFGIYIDFNGSMAFWNESWSTRLGQDSVVSKIEGVFIMGGVYSDKTPVTMPAIPGVLNRFSSATMNQLYHPRNTADFFAFIAQNKIRAFVITNNVVQDLSDNEGLEKFLKHNALDGPYLRELANAHYTSRHKPPKKPFDYYTALAMRTKLQTAGGESILTSNPRRLFYSNVYGMALVSGSEDWEGTRAKYIQQIDLRFRDEDTDKERNKKLYFTKEVAILQRIDFLASLPVYDVHFHLDPDTKKLTVIPGDTGGRM